MLNYPIATAEQGAPMNVLRRDFLKYCIGSAAALGVDFSTLGPLGRKLLAAGGPPPCQNTRSGRLSRHSSRRSIPLIRLRARFLLLYNLLLFILSHLLLHTCRRFARIRSRNTRQTATVSGILWLLTAMCLSSLTFAPAYRIRRRTHQTLRRLPPIQISARPF